MDTLDNKVQNISQQPDEPQNDTAQEASVNESVATPLANETQADVAPAQAVTVEKAEDTAEASAGTTEQAKHYNAMNRKELLEQLRSLIDVNDDVVKIRGQVDNIKQVFYKKLKNEIAALGDLTENVIDRVPDAIEEEFKGLLAQYRERKAAANAQMETEYEKNLEAKNNILKQLEDLIAAPGDLSATIPAFRKLQQEWKNIGPVPQAQNNTIWKNYSRYQEQFYDLIKDYNVMRDYDFKKNMELKIALCERAEKLSEENDPVLALKELQKLHAEWHEIGPVAREEREAIWDRFKGISSEIHKKHQAYFETIKQQEEANLQTKIKLCEQIEAIDVTSLKTFKDWDEASGKIIDMQAQWKQIGLAPKKQNGKIFRRFHQACDKFFKAKSEYYKQVKEQMAQNYAKKQALCEQAEALKDSNDWKVTADKFVELQKEWKTIGATAKKYATPIWKRFSEACDYFFEQFNEKGPKRGKPEEIENLKKKKEIIEQINGLEMTEDPNADRKALRKLMDAYNAIGFVPYRDKETLQKSYKAACDEKFDMLRSRGATGSAHRGAAATHKSSAERNRLVRQFETLKSEITTYENNLGFLNASSKKGNILVEQMNQKVAALKEQLADIVLRIDTLDKAENTQEQSAPEQPTTTLEEQPKTTDEAKADDQQVTNNEVQPEENR